MLGIFPAFIFITLFLGSGLYYQDFYRISLLTLVIITSLLSLILYPNISIKKKIKNFSLAAGHRDIITMILIFMLASIFSELTSVTHSVKSVVNLTLNFIPQQYFSFGIFLTCSLISFSLGSSMGTVLAITPIIVKLGQSISHFDLAPCLAAIMGGAIFGDNLSLISDTSIAATNALKVRPIEKFRENLKLVIPAFLISMILYFVFSRHQPLEIPTNLPYKLILTLPYIIVIILAIIGRNVVEVLGSGILLCIVLFFYRNGFSQFEKLLFATQVGVKNMLELSLLSLCSAGLVGLVKLYGGLDYLANVISKIGHSQKGAKLSMGLIACIADLITANNTIAIISIGSVAKKLTDKFKIKPALSASIIDIFSASTQGIIPYGAQMLAMYSLSKVPFIKIYPYLFYNYSMVFVCLIFLLVERKK